MDAHPGIGRVVSLASMSLAILLLVAPACSSSPDDVSKSTETSPLRGSGMVPETLGRAGVLSNSPDDCQAFIDKAWAMLPAIAPTKVTREQFLAGCHMQASKGHASPMLRCVALAHTNDEVKACLTTAKEIANDMAADSLSEPAFMQYDLDRLATRVRAVFDRDHRFVVGHAPSTPAIACCAQPGHRCRIVNEDWDRVEVWAQLGFRISREPFGAQLSYDSDGSTFSATAVADPSCNGSPISFRMTGHIEAGQAVISKPSSL